MPACIKSWQVKKVNTNIIVTVTYTESGDKTVDEDALVKVNTIANFNVDTPKASIDWSQFDVHQTPYLLSANIPHELERRAAFDNMSKLNASLSKAFEESSTTKERLKGNK